MISVLILQALCVLMFGIGCVFFIIDLQTRFGPQFRYFSIQLLVLNAINFVDQSSYWSGLSIHQRILINQINHALICLFILNTISFAKRLLGRTLCQRKNPTLLSPPIPAFFHITYLGTIKKAPSNVEEAAELMPENLSA